MNPHKYYPNSEIRSQSFLDYLLLFDVVRPPHTGTTLLLRSFRNVYCEASSGISSYLRGNSQAIGNPSALERFFSTVNISFPSMTEHSSARPQRTPVLSCSRKMTSILPVYSVILNRNIWHLPGSLPPRSTVSVWTGSSAGCAGSSHNSQHQKGVWASARVGQIRISQDLSRSYYRHRGYRAGQDPADPLRRRFLPSLGTGGRLREVGETFKGLAAERSWKRSAYGSVMRSITNPSPGPSVIPPRIGFSGKAGR